MRKIVCISMELCLCFALLLGNTVRAIDGKAVRLQQGMGSQAREAYYASLQEALDQVAYRFAQITLLEPVQESVNYRGMYSLTLDLNGNVLTGTGDTALTHTGAGALTLKSSKPGGGIQGTMQGSLVQSQRGLTIQSGEYRATDPNGTAIVNETGKISIQEYGGEIWIQGGTALRDDSDQALELDGGRLIGTAMGFAVEKLAGSLTLDGKTQIQGKLGGLYLRTGAYGQEIGPGEKSFLHLEGASIQATLPGGVALRIHAAPEWDVELDGEGGIAGDTALRLESGALTITAGAQAQLDGKVEGGAGLLLEGGRYREEPAAEWIAQGLYVAADADGWYTLGSTPPSIPELPDTGSNAPVIPGQQPGDSEAAGIGQDVPSIPIPQGEGENEGWALSLPKTGQPGSWILPALLAAGSLAGLLARGAAGPKPQGYRKSGKGH